VWQWQIANLIAESRDTTSHLRWLARQPRSVAMKHLMSRGALFLYNQHPFNIFIN